MHSTPPKPSSIFDGPNLIFGGVIGFCLGMIAAIPTEIPVQQHIRYVPPYLPIGRKRVRIPYRRRRIGSN